MPGTDSTKNDSRVQQVSCFVTLQQRKCDDENLLAPTHISIGRYQTGQNQ